MSISLSSITNASTITNLRHRHPAATPSGRFITVPFAAKTYGFRFCVANSSNASTPESSDFDSSSMKKQGSNGKDESVKATSSNEMLDKLKRYGVSGILSYGLLNTVYYLTTFLVVWFYVAPVPGKMGYLAAAERFLKVMAMVWAGSQVTKLIRAGGRRGFDRHRLCLTLHLHRWTAEDEAVLVAFAAIAGLCFGLAFLMFVIVTLLSA